MTEQTATFINGGRTYKLPNDSSEQSRLETQSNGLFELMHRRHIHASLEKPSRILDIGCGVGTVTRWLGLQFPESTVIGVDLSPVPDWGNTPPNVRYLQGDVKDLAGKHDELSYGTFDLVFSRLLILGMVDRPTYVDTAGKLARPGGFVEMQEFMGPFAKAADALGMDMDAAINLKRYMSNAGLQDIKETVYKWPLGDWMKQTNPESVLIGMSSVAPEGLPRASRLGIAKMLENEASQAEIKDMQDEATQKMVPTSDKYWPWMAVLGRKP